MSNKLNSASSENEVKPMSLKNNVLVQELEKELLLYDLDRGKAFCLNETSLAVWNLCNGENSIEDIRRKVSIQLKTQITKDMIWLAVHSLKEEKLLSNHQDIEINFSGLTRREVIKKVGLATMTALPLIMTLVTPLPAAALSLNVCPSSTVCFCADASCVRFGDVALLQDACASSTCSGTGGSNCQCVGRFFCGVTAGTRFGMCGLV